MSFFFFQAEDGIRDLIVTGVQTCALPISIEHLRGDRGGHRVGIVGFTERRLLCRGRGGGRDWRVFRARFRRGGRGSEERRVGEEGRSRGAPDHLKKKKIKSMRLGDRSCV